jgi:hypothetical protein
MILSPNRRVEEPSICTTDTSKTRRSLVTYTVTAHNTNTGESPKELKYIFADYKDKKCETSQYYDPDAMDIDEGNSVPYAKDKQNKEKKNREKQK